MTDFWGRISFSDDNIAVIGDEACPQLLEAMVETMSGGYGRDDERSGCD